MPLYSSWTQLRNSPLFPQDSHTAVERREGVRERVAVLGVGAPPQGRAALSLSLSRCRPRPVPAVLHNSIPLSPHGQLGVHRNRVLTVRPGCFCLRQGLTREPHRRIARPTQTLAEDG